MTVARSSLVSLSATPYYHVIGRCVRRAFLCGVDSASGRCFEHRREWIVERLALLSSVFAIDVCAYTVMSNHYHLVVKLNPAVVSDWSNTEVIRRWCSLYSSHPLIRRQQAGESLSPGELSAVSDLVAVYRTRLADLSWFMRGLNHHIACRANDEDNCTGHFWEGRFKSQALLDEQALLSCMAYVDLNPIRAGMVDTPEQSDFTSVQQRIKQSRTRPVHQTETLAETIPGLLGFTGKLDDDQGLPFSMDDYLKLVDWSGRAIHPGKKGKIPDDIPPILTRLSIDPNELIHRLSKKRPGFYHVIGRATTIREAINELGATFLKGIAAASRLFPQRQ